MLGMAWRDLCRLLFYFWNSPTHNACRFMSFLHVLWRINVPHTIHLCMCQKMWKAAKMGNAEEVKGHLMAGGDINYRMEPYGDTPLTISASYGHLEVVEQLLTAGADVNMTDTTYHATPLFWAAYGGHVNIVVALIKAGANVEQSDINAVTPLEIAAERGHAGVVEALLVAGADPNRLDLLGDTPLHVASVTLGPASERIVNDLLDAGANIDAQSLDGGTPLMWSVMFGNANTTRVLLLRGADASVEDGMGRRAEDLICQCKLSRGLDHLLQCPPGGCDKKSTVKAIKKYLETL